MKIPWKSMEYAYVLNSASSTMNLQNSIQLNVAQCNSIQLNADEYSSIQLNTTQCNLKNHWIQLCFGQCELYDESSKFNTAQCSSMQFNTAQCRWIQLNTAEYSSMQFQKSLNTPMFWTVRALRWLSQILADFSRRFQQRISAVGFSRGFQQRLENVCSSFCDTLDGERSEHRWDLGSFWTLLDGERSEHRWDLIEVAGPCLEVVQMLL